MKDARAVHVILSSDKIAFLDEVTKKYGLPDTDKAVRCLIDFAREHPDQHEAMFNEPRCVDC